MLTYRPYGEKERKKMLLALPTRKGWSVSWYTGEVRPRTRKMKDGTRKVVGEIRFKESFESTSKEKVEQKAKELKEQGFEVEGIYECIF
jgi:hypothetical protein